VNLTVQTVPAAGLLIALCLPLLLGLLQLLLHQLPALHTLGHLEAPLGCCLFVTAAA
jgi:hypothetical protein